MKKKNIALIVLIVLGAALIGAALGIVYSSPNRDNPIDTAVSDFFYVTESEQGIGHKIMGIITYLGESIIYIALLVILYYVWDKKKAYRIIVTLVSSMTVNAVTKVGFGFDRPDDSFGYDPVDKITYGLPSGHAQLSTTVWGTLAASVAKWGMITVGIALPLLIGFSRIYLVVHWFTDVLMGFGIGMLVVGIFILVEKPVGNFLDKQSIIIKILVALLVFAVFALPIIFLHEGSSNPDEFKQKIRILKTLVLFTTASISYALEGKLVGFNSRADKWWKYILRILLVAIPIGVIYVYDQILTDDMALEALKISLDMVVYALMGPILFLLVPWIVKKLNL
ncbi:MAG: phosphatase PAP2 family protein [Asgard group archaeon]|nr:phosphatase PAP2 family protein [Asgard group archaeon]